MNDSIFQDVTLSEPATSMTGPAGTHLVQQTHINWGKVVKGALLVTAVVGVAAVGFWAVGTMASGGMAAITGSSSVDGIAAAAVEGVNTTVGWIGAGLSYVGSMLYNVPGMIANTFGLHGSLTTTTLFGTSTPVANALPAAAGVVGAAGLGTVMYHGIHPQVHDVITNSVSQHYVPVPDASTTTIDPNHSTIIMAGQAGAHNAAMEMAHAGHEAHELNEQIKEHSQWRDQFALRNTTSGYANAVGKRETRSMLVAPRDANWAEHVTAETAQLNNSLAK